MEPGQAALRTSLSFTAGTSTGKLPGDAVFDSSVQMDSRARRVYKQANKCLMKRTPWLGQKALKTGPPWTAGALVPLGS